MNSKQIYEHKKGALSEFLLKVLPLKGGGDLLSHIAVQYHRRAWA